MNRHNFGGGLSLGCGSLLRCGLLLWCLAVAGTCGWAGELFTKYNIHVQDKVDKNGQHKYSASCSNWTDPGVGHLVIPVNTAIEILATNAKLVKFKVVADGKIVELDFNTKWMMGMSVDKYVELITTAAQVPLDTMSELDRTGIKDGKVSVGMTKAGVMKAFGYPAAHRTPNPDTDKRWVYWTNRWQAVAIEFDDAGLVKNISH